MPKYTDVNKNESSFKSENESVLEQMLKAEKAEEPSKSTSEEVTKTIEDNPAPMKFAATKSAGYSYIYDTITGERSLTNNNMLMAQLKKARPDGTKVFTTIEPKNVVKAKGAGLKCYLHMDDSQRKHFDEMGLPVCRKANLISEFHRVRHMQKKHKDEWAAIEAEKKANKDLATEAAVRDLLKKITG